MYLLSYKSERVNIWKERLSHHPSTMKVPVSEDLPSGENSDWTEWKTRNRLRTGVGRSKEIWPSGDIRRVETHPVISAWTNKHWTTCCAALYWTINAHLMTWQATMRMQRHVFSSGCNTRDHVLWTREEKIEIRFDTISPQIKPYSVILHA